MTLQSPDLTQRQLERCADCIYGIALSSELGNLSASVTSLSVLGDREGVSPFNRFITRAIHKVGEIGLEGAESADCEVFHQTEAEETLPAMCPKLNLVRYTDEAMVDLTTQLATELDSHST
jgi:hypothetical protein